MSIRDKFRKKLIEAFSLQPAGVVYPSNEKPAIKVKMSSCTKEEKARMTSMINRLAKSPRGKETLEIAAKNGFEFKFMQSSAIGFADPENKVIALSPMYNDNKLIGTLCHEARHAGQMSRSNVLDTQDVMHWDVKTNLIYKRAMEADAQAYAVCACEELSRVGDVGPKQEFDKCYPEIATGLSKALSENNNEMNNQVLTDSFKSWYDQKRMKTAYENAYVIQPMRADAIYSSVLDKSMFDYSMSVCVEQTVSEIMQTRNGTYFTDSPEVLKTGKYLDVSASAMKQMQKYFDYRTEFTGDDKSSCLEGIPVRPKAFGERVKTVRKLMLPKSLKEAIKPELEKIIANKTETQQKSKASKMAQIQKRMSHNR